MTRVKIDLNFDIKYSATLSFTPSGGWGLCWEGERSGRRGRGRGSSRVEIVYQPRGVWQGGDEGGGARRETVGERTGGRKKFIGTTKLETTLQGGQLRRLEELVVLLRLEGLMKGRRREDESLVTWRRGGKEHSRKEFGTGKS